MKNIIEIEGVAFTDQELGDFLKDVLDFLNVPDSPETENGLECAEYITRDTVNKAMKHLIQMLHFKNHPIRIRMGSDTLRVGYYNSLNDFIVYSVFQAGDAQEARVYANLLQSSYKARLEAEQGYQIDQMFKDTKQAFAFTEVIPI